MNNPHRNKTSPATITLRTGEALAVGGWVSMGVGLIALGWIVVHLPTILVEGVTSFSDAYTPSTISLLQPVLLIVHGVVTGILAISMGTLLIVLHRTASRRWRAGVMYVFACTLFGWESAIFVFAFLAWSDGLAHFLTAWGFCVVFGVAYPILLCCAAWRSSATNW